MILNSIYKVLPLLLLMLANGCHTNMRNHALVEEPSVPEALKLGFDIALKDSILTDCNKTQNSLGAYRLLVNDKEDIAIFRQLKDYHFILFDSNTICQLNNGDYYLIYNKLRIKSDTAIFRLDSDCVFKTQDTRIQRLYCGGNIWIKMKKSGSAWISTDTLGMSD